MNLTLHTGDKLVLVLASSSITLASVTADMQAGNIKHDPATKIGRQIVASFENDGAGTLTLASIVKGDLDANGVKNADDVTIAGVLTVLTGPGIAVLDENAVFSGVEAA